MDRMWTPLIGFGMLVKYNSIFSRLTILEWDRVALEVDRSGIVVERIKERLRASSKMVEENKKHENGKIVEILYNLL